MGLVASAPCAGFHKYETLRGGFLPLTKPVLWNHAHPAASWHKNLSQHWRDHQNLFAGQYLGHPHFEWEEIGIVLTNSEGTTCQHNTQHALCVL